MKLHVSGEHNQAYEFRTALLKVDADENVFPSRYLFSPLILCFILRSNSSAFGTKGESEACQFQQLLVHQINFNFSNIYYENMRHRCIIMLYNTICYKEFSLLACVRFWKFLKKQTKEGIDLSYHNPSPSISKRRNMSWVRHNICTQKEVSEPCDHFCSCLKGMTNGKLEKATYHYFSRLLTFENLS